MADLDSKKLYLDYLDKEMLIMGVLSAFCAAVLSLSMGKIASVKIDASSSTEIGARVWTEGRGYFILGSIALLLATFNFYVQRSLLAFYYGQISLNLAREAPVSQLLDEADSWTTWVAYRWGFTYLFIGISAYLVAITMAAFPSVNGSLTGLLFLDLVVLSILIMARIAFLLRRKPYDDDPAAWPKFAGTKFRWAAIYLFLALLLGSVEFLLRRHIPGLL